MEISPGFLIALPFGKMWGTSSGNLYESPSPVGTRERLLNSISLLINQYLKLCNIVEELEYITGGL